MNYECHITIAVKDAEKALAMMETLGILGWKNSEIKRDPLLGDASHYYFTCHSTAHGRIETRMKHLADRLRSMEIEVLREKIELIVYDTKTGVGL